MEIKICKKCNEEKIISLFGVDKKRNDGFNIWCKSCISLYHLENKIKKQIYYLENKSQINQRCSEYRENNKEKLKEYSELYRKENFEKVQNYYINNKEKLKEYSRKNKKETNFKHKCIEEKKESVKDYKRNRYKNDILFRLKSLMRRKINGYLIENNYKKNNKSIDVLGCTIEEFKLYLESKFEPWMTWENQGNPKDGIIEFNKTWDIDHIIPLSSVKTEEEIIKLNHFTNLQPLCSKYNREIKRDNT